MWSCLDLQCNVIWGLMVKVFGLCFRTHLEYMLDLMFL